MEEATAYPGNTINRRKNDANNSRAPGRELNCCGLRNAFLKQEVDICIEMAYNIHINVNEMRRLQ